MTDLTPEQIAMCDAAAVMPTARHAIEALVERLEKVADPHALREAKVALRALEWIDVRITAKLR